MKKRLSADEYSRCRNGYEGFIYWCETYALVEDKDSQRAIPFKLWACQKKVAKLLVNHKWIWALKARRLGLTWLMVAYAVWLITFFPNRQIVVMNQDVTYAKDFLDRFRFVQDQLPEAMQLARVNAKGKSSDNKQRIDFNRHGHGCLIRSVACTKRAIRSIAADLVIFDEAAYMELLNTARLAAQPAVETGKGQIVGITTSSGPQGDFYDTWDRAVSGKNKYTPVFLHWKEHPKRNDAWYKNEQAENESDPLYMKREYPSTPEEAFESAQGRVYPLFTAHGENASRFIRRVDILPNTLKRYRAIDFGGVDPFVTLWGAVIPGDGHALTVDPDCTNLIRELLAYSRDKNGDPADESNHANDALRYMVVTPGNNGLVGHLHIYRELYIANSAAKGLSLPDLAQRIKSMSTGENYDLTIADRSRPDSITLLNQMDIRTIPQKQLQSMGGRRSGEIEQGIIRVNSLIVGTAKGINAVPITAQKIAALDSLKNASMFG